jgi:hypothetical protein
MKRRGDPMAGLLTERADVRLLLDRLVERL